MDFLLSIAEEDYTTKIITEKGFLETLGFGGQMLLQGMLTVFSVLCIIWGALILFRVFFHDIPGKRAKKAPEKTSVAVSEAVEASDNDAELVAVLAAAIAMAESESGGLKFRVVSFTRK